MNKPADTSLRPALEKLDRLLSRAKSRVALQERLKERRSNIARQNSEAARLALDFALRLQEKHRMRRLLSSPDLDGERFRFYFSVLEPSTNLDHLRDYIDSRIAQEIQHELAQKTPPAASLSSNAANSRSS